MVKATIELADRLELAGEKEEVTENKNWLSLL